MANPGRDTAKSVWIMPAERGITPAGIALMPGLQRHNMLPREAGAGPKDQDDLLGNAGADGGQCARFDGSTGALDSRTTTHLQGIRSALLAWNTLMCDSSPGCLPLRDCNVSRVPVQHPSRWRRVVSARSRRSRRIWTQPLRWYCACCGPTYCIRMWACA